MSLAILIYISRSLISAIDTFLGSLLGLALVSFAASFGGALIGVHVARQLCGDTFWCAVVGATVGGVLAIVGLAVILVDALTRLETQETNLIQLASDENEGP